jgi:hypothetical protein
MAGWRRTRSIGLLGLGQAATFALLASLIVVLIIAAISLRALLYLAPALLAAGTAVLIRPGGTSLALIRPGGTSLALLAVQRLRWQYATRKGQTGYRAEVVQHHAGTLQLPGTLAATELLTAEDGFGGRYGIVRDRHAGYLTATLRVVATSPWLANPADADSWVANWGAWLASLGYLPAVRWITVTIDTAPDPGSTLASHVAASIDPTAPQAARDIMNQLVATAPAAAADVDTRVSVTFDPAAYPSNPRTVTAATAEVGQSLAGLEAALAVCGLTLLGRARAADLAGIVRTAFDPAVRGEVSRLLTADISPRLETGLNWASAGPQAAQEEWDYYRHDSGISVTWTWREAPRQNVRSDVLARLVAPGSYAKRVSIQYRPFPAAAANALDSEVRAAEFRREYSRRTRRDLTARDAHDHARARQAADEEARGAGVGLIGLYVTVTVTDPALLGRVVADTEASADLSKIALRRLYRSQAAGFSATLPCGICLPELAARLRH